MNKLLARAQRLAELADTHAAMAEQEAENTGLAADRAKARAIRTNATLAKGYARAAFASHTYRERAKATRLVCRYSDAALALVIF
jgi:hypothetical protein